MKRPGEIPKLGNEEKKTMPTYTEMHDHVLLKYLQHVHTCNGRTWAFAKPFLIDPSP
jgi:hypothetical protein